MRVRTISLAAAISLAALGWSSAPAQARADPNLAQQQDRSRENNRSSGPSSREGARHAEDQQGVGYNAPESNRQRGRGDGSGSVGRSYQGQRGDNPNPRYARARALAQGHLGGAQRHDRHCRHGWRHQHRVHACR
jgi:hypothetical protein